MLVRNHVEHSHGYAYGIESDRSTGTSACMSMNWRRFGHDCGMGMQLTMGARWRDCNYDQGCRYGRASGRADEHGDVREHVHAI